MLTDKNYRITVDFTFSIFCSDTTTFSYFEYFVNLLANNFKYCSSIKMYNQNRPSMKTMRWYLLMIGYYLVYFEKWVLLAYKPIQCRMWHRLIQMNSLTAIYNAERLKNKCAKVAFLLILQTDHQDMSSLSLHCINY